MSASTEMCTWKKSRLSPLTCIAFARQGSTLCVVHAHHGSAVDKASHRSTGWDYRSPQERVDDWWKARL